MYVCICIYMYVHMLKGGDAYLYNIIYVHIQIRFWTHVSHTLEEQRRSVLRVFASLSSKGEYITVFTQYIYIYTSHTYIYIYIHI